MTEKPIYRTAILLIIFVSIMILLSILFIHEIISREVTMIGSAVANIISLSATDIVVFKRIRENEIRQEILWAAKIRGK